MLDLHRLVSEKTLDDPADAGRHRPPGMQVPAVFIHPVMRAITLHFWLAYDHPFCDGNGRTARALFYWSMLKQGYWLFEFISISSVINQAPWRGTSAHSCSARPMTTT